ncbi:MAG: hypothetical protein JRI76_06370 [Deltaproteobacteria bacterium]|nr:hypothetical protein [Deltaproteobacteria bacterium]MBW2041647.1 hypothetical protein [Deltaproteobacteria bacterium]
MEPFRPEGGLPGGKNAHFIVASLGIGVASLAVDLFRAVDAFWKKRCWTSFGVLSFIIDLPNYMKFAFAAPDARKEGAPRPEKCLF